MKLSAKNLILLALMLLSATLGASLRPTISLADERPPIDLATMVPIAFGEWREQVNLSNQIVDPVQKEKIDKIYSQTLSRTYINAQGYRVMLSIAYGRNQSDALQMHKPEICYPAQGFTLLSNQASKLDLFGNAVAAKRLTTNLANRHEPITYWTIVGDHVVTGSTDKKITEIRYALNGRIPDGMLVRFSSIDLDTARAFNLQTKFATEMIRAIEPASQRRFAGSGL